MKFRIRRASDDQWVDVEIDVPLRKVTLVKSAPAQTRRPMDRSETAAAFRKAFPQRSSLPPEPRPTKAKSVRPYYYFVDPTDYATDAGSHDLWLATLGQVVPHEVLADDESDVDYDWGSPRFRRLLSWNTNDFRDGWPHSPDFDYFEIDL